MKNERSRRVGFVAVDRLVDAGRHRLKRVLSAVRRSTGDDGTDRPSEGPRVYGVRTVRESGGSVVVTIPPEGIEASDLSVGDDVVVWGDGESVSVTERRSYLDRRGEK